MFRLAGVEKITFATDGHLFSPWVEKAKIDTLRLPAPYRTPPLTVDEYALIMGGNTARPLGMARVVDGASAGPSGVSLLGLRPRQARKNGPGGIRTPDLCDANAALSQLSHRPTTSLL
jgi:hypothetical protein